MREFFIQAGAIALLATSAFAQYQFETTFGTPLAVGDDTIVANQALGFTFTMPGGVSGATINIDSNGRILPGGGAEASDFSESTAELLTEAHSSICLQWDDMGMHQPAADDVYFNTNGTTKAWVTWNNAVQLSSLVTHTMQVQLFSDGRIVLLYDSRCPALDGLVGLSSGSPAVANAVDLSAAPFSTGANPTVYQIFTTAWDLQSTALAFAPNGTGWNVAKNAVVDINAKVAGTGVGCYEEGPSIVYTPDGKGGYGVTRTHGLYDPNVGVSAGITSDDQISPGSQDLTFVFPFPGGSTGQFIDIDSNGRVLRDATDAAFDNSPTVAEFRTEAWPVIAVHADWNVAAAGSDDIYFSTTAGVSARITWKDVLQFGAAAGTPTCTCQIQLYASGVIIICMREFKNFNPPAPFVGPDDLIVGVSPGGGPVDPGETDYMGIVGTANTGAMNYEFTDNPGELSDYHTRDPLLVSVTLPRLNSSWDLRIDRLPTGTSAAWFMIGFSNSNIDLAPLDIPCTLRVDLAMGAVPATVAGASTTVLPIPIGPDPMQVGVTAYVQGLTIPTGVNPFLPIVLTNGIAATVGF